MGVWARRRNITIPRQRRGRARCIHMREEKRERERNNDADAELRVHTMHSYESSKNEITIQIRTEKAHEVEKRTRGERKRKIMPMENSVCMRERKERGKILR